MLDLHDVKFTSKMQVDLLDNRYIPWINSKGPFVVKVDLDEILQVSATNATGNHEHSD